MYLVHIDVLLEVKQLLGWSLKTLVAQQLLKGLLGISQPLEREGVTSQTEVDVVLWRSVQEGGKKGGKKGGRREGEGREKGGRKEGGGGRGAEGVR